MLFFPFPLFNFPPLLPPSLPPFHLHTLALDSSTNHMNLVCFSHEACLLNYFMNQAMAMTDQLNCILSISELKYLHSQCFLMKPYFYYRADCWKELN